MHPFEGILPSQDQKDEAQKENGKQDRRSLLKAMGVSLPLFAIAKRASAYEELSATSMAIGEEGGDKPRPITEAIGEEGGRPRPTTKKLGEEGGPACTTKSGEDGWYFVTTEKLEEEGGKLVITKADGETGLYCNPMATTLSEGEEGGGKVTTQAFGEEGGNATTHAFGEEGGDDITITTVEWGEEG